MSQHPLLLGAVLLTAFAGETYLEVDSWVSRLFTNPSPNLIKIKSHEKYRESVTYTVAYLHCSYSA